MLNRTTFDGLYGQDAFAYLEYGKQFRHALQQFQIPPPSYWPLGFPSMLASGFSIFGESVSVAQWTVMISSGLIAILTYLFTVDLMRWWANGQVAGLVAGLIMAFSSQLLQSSIVIMADAPALFWAVLSGWALARYRLMLDHRGRYFWIGLAGFALGYATITRWVYGTLGLGWAIYCLWGWQAQIKAYWKDGLMATIMGGLVLIPQYLHSRANPKVLEAHVWLKNWSFHHIFEKDFSTTEGTYHYAETNAVFYLHVLFDTWYMPTLFSGFFMMGIMAMGKQRHLQAISLLCLWFIVPYLFLAGIPFQSARFALVLLVPVAVVAGLGAGKIWEWIGLMRPLALRIAVRGAMLLMILITGWPAYDQANEALEKIIVQKNADLSAIHRTEAYVEPNAVIYTLDLWTLMRYYSPLETRQLYYEKPETIAENLPTDRPTYLLVNGWAIHNQWVGQLPWQNYQALQQKPGMTRLVRFGNYHLFRIQTERLVEADGWLVELGR